MEWKDHFLMEFSRFCWVSGNSDWNTGKLQQYTVSSCSQFCR